MISFDLDVTINCPVEAAFAFAHDPATFPQWQPAVVESRQTSPGPMGVGATGVNVRKVMGQRVESTFEITSYTQNQVLVVKSTSGPVAYEITYSFQPVDGGTRLLLHFQGEPQGIFKAAERVLAPTIKKDFDEDYQRLKALLESC
ncbi:MAG TPA: SRPBCC family protein [Ktedonobacterales bacterium]